MATAYIVKRGKSHQVKWRQDGRQHSKTFKTAKDAGDYLDELRDRLNKGTATPAAARGMTYEDWWTTFMAQRHVAPSTAATAKVLADKHVLPVLGDRLLSDIKQQDIQTLVSSLQLAPASVSRVYQEIRTSFNAAVNAGYLYVTPCRGIRLPKRPGSRVNVLTRKEMKKVQKKVPEIYRALIEFQWTTGLRISEALALTPKDIRGGVVRVHQSKTHAGIREVPLSPATQKMLKKHMKKYPGTWVFTGPRGGQIDQRNFSQRIFRPAAKAIKRPEIVVHDLRHSAATLYIKAGFSPARVASLLGHESAAFTMSTYAAWFRDDDSDLLAALDRL